jgi:hypothetical protein
MLIEVPSTSAASRRRKSFRATLGGVVAAVRFRFSFGRVITHVLFSERGVSFRLLPIHTDGYRREA